jgi:short subunit dehydrogenase-like uncharacterized protein
MYILTGVFLAEAAITVLRDETPARKYGGGVLTPAMLGQSYIDRLAKVGYQATIGLDNEAAQSKI